MNHSHYPNLLIWFKNIISRFQLQVFSYTKKSMLSAIPIFFCVLICYHLHLQHANACIISSNQDCDQHSKGVHTLGLQNGDLGFQQFRYSHKMLSIEIQKFIKEYSISPKDSSYQTEETNVYFRCILEQLQRKRAPLELVLLQSKK